MDAVAAATGALGELEERRRAAVARQGELAEERSRLSYAALAGDDKAAAKRLAALTQETATADLEIENIRSAIVEAKARLAAAERDAEMAAELKRAEQARERLAAFRALGGKLEAALQQLIEAYGGYHEAAREVRGLGYGGPDHSLMRVNIANAIEATLMQAKLNSRVIAPSQRRSIAALTADWSRDMEVRIDRVLEAGSVAAQ